MQTAKAILLGGAAIIAWNVYNKANAAGKLTFYPAGVKSLRLEGTTPIVTIGVRIQNTSNQKLVLKALAGYVYANTYLIGNLSSFTPYDINPVSEVVINFDVRLSLLSIVQDIITAFQTHNFTQKMKFEGTANCDSFQVPLKFDYTVGI